MTKKREVVLRIFRGESLDSLSRELGVEIYRLGKWRDATLGGIDVALKSRTEDPLKAEYDSAMKRVGELTMENELLWQRVRRPGPLAKRRSKKWVLRRFKWNSLSKEVGDWGCDQVDHGYEVRDVSVASGPGASGLEETV